MKLGKWITNIDDPDHPSSRGKKSDTEWKQHMKYVAENVIGPPKASKTCTVEQLKGWHIVGLYKRE